VLNGLSIKISGRGGKITAVFSGKDTEVLKLIKQNADGLKSALQGRGLTLAELRIEERK
jgi:flagellar hook-length control protein FliK